MLTQITKVRQNVSGKTIPVFCTHPVFPHLALLSRTKCPTSSEGLPWDRVPRSRPDRFCSLSPRPLSSAHERHLPPRAEADSSWPAAAGTGPRSTGQVSMSPRLLTCQVHIPEAGEGGIQTGTFLLVGSIFLHGLTHLLVRHLQEVL